MALPDLCLWCSRRFIFNWAHWAVGSVTEILAGWFHSRGLKTLLEGSWNVDPLRLCSARQWRPCSWGSVSRPSCSPSPGPPTFWLATWSGWPYSGSSSSCKSTFMPKVVRTQPNNNLDPGWCRAAGLNFLVFFVGPAAEAPVNHKFILPWNSELFRWVCMMQLLYIYMFVFLVVSSEHSWESRVFQGSIIKSFILALMAAGNVGLLVALLVAIVQLWCLIEQTEVFDWTDRSVVPLQGREGQLMITHLGMFHFFVVIIFTDGSVSHVAVNSLFLFM